MRAYGEVPIIAMTASALEEDRELAVQAGMVDFLAKPFDKQQLYTVVQRNLPTVPDRTREVRRRSPAIGERNELGIDARTGLSNSGGDAVRYRELLTQLSVSARELLDISLRAGPEGEHREPSHSLIGAAGMLGAHRLAAVAAAMESAPDTAADKVLNRNLLDGIALIERYLKQAW